MKKLLITSCLLMSCAAAAAGPANKPAQEGVDFINADGSPLGDICLAAVESRQAMLDEARRQEISPFELSELRCNGLPVERFAAKYRERDAEPVLYTFDRGDDSLETELCYAAVTSEDYYQSLKNNAFGRVTNVEQEVLCNGIPLEQFARKFGKPNLTAAR